MSSLTRRMQRSLKRDNRKGRSGIPHFGSKIGVKNPKAKDLLARLARESRA